MVVKKKMAPQPFHEVAFEILEKGSESEGYKKLDEWVDYGQDAAIVIAFLLTRCVVPEKEQSRIVPALIAATKKVQPGDIDSAKVFAFALTHFHPGKKGLKELEKLLSEEYLATEKDSDESYGLVELIVELGLEVPERPENE